MEKKREEKLTTDHPLRSIIKAVSWRITGTIDTVLIAFLITGHMKWALSIGGLEVLTKLLWYYLHERAWNRISFGKRKEPVDNYTI